MGGRVPRGEPKKSAPGTRWNGSLRLCVRICCRCFLPGYKGPDVYSRGVDPESEAFFFLDELEDIILRVGGGGVSPPTP